MASYARAAAGDVRAASEGAATESDEDEAAQEDADLKAAIQACPCNCSSTPSSVILACIQGRLVDMQQQALVEFKTQSAAHTQGTCAVQVQPTRALQCNVQVSTAEQKCLQSFHSQPVLPSLPYFMM